MADVGHLSLLVKSLTRDVEERREAVGLLLDLSDLIAVRRRMGRIQGCIVMLVAMLNGDDPVASQNAGKLLNTLSSNTQNALHMAEAGYFKPLVQYLKEGDHDAPFFSVCLNVLFYLYSFDPSQHGSKSIWVQMCIS
jgi:vacuolar protein 8